MIYTLTLNPALDYELTVPALLVDDVLRATATRFDPGGKGFNVSRALHALGLDSLALGLVGGTTGERLVRGLEAAGLQAHCIWIEGETRTNTSLIDARSEHYIKVNEPGPTIHAEERDVLLTEIQQLVRPGDWWVLSGSLPPGLEPSFYTAIITLVQAAGARAVLDTSGEALQLGCQAKPYLVKPNQDEAEHLTGLRFDPDDPAFTLDALHALGAQHIALTLGENGALYSDGDQIWRAAAPPITLGNPIGAGDAFLAGLLWAFHNGKQPAGALAWATACGAAAASLDGTAAGSYDQVAALEQQVAITLLPGD